MSENILRDETVISLINNMTTVGTEHSFLNRVWINYLLLTYY